MEKTLMKIKPFVTELFIRRPDPRLTYHNLHHTETVVERCFEIAANYSLSETELFCLRVAAWFHDTGHLFNELSDHEQAGADLMAALLKSRFISDELIETISACILVTKMPSRPQTLIEKILCDADTYHFGTKEFLQTDPKIYEEMESRLNIYIENKRQKSLQLLEHHQFFTDYCQRLLTSGKKENIDYLKRLS